MLINEAIARATALTGQVVDNAALVRWLSELDGRLAFEFYRADAWAPYDPEADLDCELLVPFPWDGLYVHRLAAMTYFSDGEYDRYENERVMGERTLTDFRHFMQRTQAAPCRPGFPTGRAGGTGATVIPAGDAGPWFWLSAYALAVKHGYTGTEDEWLDTLIGPQGPVGPAFTYADFTPAQLAALTGPQGPAGPRGPQGVQGPKGDAGTAAAVEAEGLYCFRVDGDSASATYGHLLLSYTGAAAPQFAISGSGHLIWTSD